MHDEAFDMARLKQTRYYFAANVILLSKRFEVDAAFSVHRVYPL